MPSSSTSGGGVPSSKLSPLTNGESKLASLCILEGKNILLVQISAMGQYDSYCCAKV